MSYQIRNLVRDDHTGNLTTTEKVVLDNIASRIDHRDSCPTSRPPISLIAKDTGLSARTVKRCVKSLITKKYIKKIRQGSNLKRTSNGYEVNTVQLINYVKATNPKAYIPVDKIWVLL